MASQNNNRGGFEPWDILKRQHPKLISNLIRIQILASINPKNAETLWNELAEKNGLPRALFPQLLQALSQNAPVENIQDLKEDKERKEEQKPSHSQVPHLPPSQQPKENTESKSQKAGPVSPEAPKTTQATSSTNSAKLVDTFKKYSPAYRVYDAVRNKKKQEQPNPPRNIEPQKSTAPGESTKAEKPPGKPEAGFVIPEYIKTMSPLAYGYRRLRRKKEEEKDQVPQVQPKTQPRTSTPPIRKPQIIVPEWVKSASPVFVVAKKVQGLRQNQNNQQDQNGGQPSISRGSGRNLINSVNNFSQNAINNFKRGRIVGQLGARAATAATSNPYVWVVIAVIAVILIFIYILFVVLSGGGEIPATTTTCPNTQPQSSTPIPGLTLTLTAPSEVDVSQPITYSVNINYDPSTAKLTRDEIVVYDFIPDNTTFANASGIFENDKIGSRSAILWRLKNNSSNTITLSLNATQESICVVNMFSAVSSKGGHIPEPILTPTSTVAPPSDYQAAILSQFGIQMDGFTSESLKWAYDKLREVSGTKFIDLERGHISKIFAKEYKPNDWTSVSNANGSSCPAQIELVESWPAPDGEEIFKITLIHEISHVIDRCAPENLALGRNSFGIPGNFLEVYQKEGGATYYGQHANGTASPAISGPNMTPDSSCPDGNPISEDYADMLAYYLNPTSKQKDVCKKGRLANPYDNGAHALHKSLASRILGSF